MVHRLRFNVCGHTFSISLDALQNGPESKLTRMFQREASQKIETDLIEIDRPADMFASVLAMYQTGELHFPLTSCPGAFLNELEFWEIPPEMLERCCYNRLQSFVDEQDTLMKFQESRRASRKHFTTQFTESIQGKIWSIVEYTKPSIFGKMYFIISFFMVLMSICTLAFSTDPFFRRRMTNCERLEFMESSGMDNIELARKWLAQECDTDKLPYYPPPLGVTPPNQGDNNKCKETYKIAIQIYLPYEFDNDDDYHFNDENNETDMFPLPDQSANHSDDVSTTTPMIPNTLRANQSEDLQISTTIPVISNAPKQFGRIGEFVEIPNYKIPLYIFAVFEAVTAVYFTIDIMLRLISCPSKKCYFLNIINFVDIVALTGSYLHFILMQIYKHEQYRDTWVDCLKYIQVLRSVRLFRIVSNIRAGQILAYTVQENFKDLTILILFLIVGISAFASSMFVIEERKDFPTIPAGWYWALVTMTTVGYGDITPKTGVGRVVACICAFLWYHSFSTYSTDIC